MGKKGINRYPLCLLNVVVLNQRRGGPEKDAQCPQRELQLANSGVSERCMVSSISSSIANIRRRVSVVNGERASQVGTRHPQTISHFDSTPAGLVKEPITQAAGLSDHSAEESLVDFSIGNQTFQPPAGCCRSLIIRMQAQESSQRFRRVLKFADSRLRLCHQQFDCRLGTVRLAQRPLCLLQRTLKLLLIVKRFRQRIVRVPALWIDLGGTLQRRDSKVKAIFAYERHAERTQNTGVLRVELRCLLE